MSLLKSLKKIQGIKSEIRTLKRAYMDARTPTSTKLTIALISSIYILSPIDIAPDILPLLGIVDDLLIIPLMLWIGLPNAVLDDAHAYIQKEDASKPKKRHWLWWTLLILMVIGTFFLLWQYLGFDLMNEAPIIPNNSL